MSIYNNNTGENLSIVILIYGGKIYAVGEVEQNKVLVKKVFTQV